MGKVIRKRFRPSRPPAFRQKYGLPSRRRDGAPAPTPTRPTTPARTEAEKHTEAGRPYYYGGYWHSTPKPSGVTPPTSQELASKGVTGYYDVSTGKVYATAEQMKAQIKERTIVQEIKKGRLPERKYYVSERWQQQKIRRPRTTVVSGYRPGERKDVLRTLRGETIREPSIDVGVAGSVLMGRGVIPPTEDKIVRKYTEWQTGLEKGYVGKKTGIEAWKEPFYTTGALALGTGYGFYRTVSYPVETLESMYQMIRHPKKSYYEIEAEARRRPVRFVGELYGTSLAFRLGGKVIKKGIEVGKEQYIKVGAEYIPPEKLFAPEVLKGKAQLPMAKSIAEAMKEFKTTTVVTAGRQKIPSPAWAGRKGAVGLEDPGIYVTPKGKGSPYFLRAGEKATPEYKITPTPIKSIKEAFQIPTVTEFRVAGVTRYPRRVITRPGFDPLIKYFERIGPREKAYITKRFEIGAGEIPRQYFKVTEEFPLPMKAMTVIRAGKRIRLREGEVVKPGDIVLEAGTRELEAIVPVGTQFQYKPTTTLGKIKGFEYYTKYKGEVVALRKAELLKLGKRKFTEPGLFDVIKKGKGRRITAEKIAEESRIRRPVRYKSIASLMKYSYRPLPVRRRGLIRPTRRREPVMRERRREKPVYDYGYYFGKPRRPAKITYYDKRYISKPRRPGIPGKSYYDVPPPTKTPPPPTTKKIIVFKPKRRRKPTYPKVALVGMEAGVAPTKKKFLTGFEPRPIPKGVRKIAKRRKKKR